MIPYGIASQLNPNMISCNCLGFVLPSYDAPCCRCITARYSFWLRLCCLGLWVQGLGLRVIATATVVNLDFSIMSTAVARCIYRVIQSEQGKIIRGSMWTIK